MPAFHRATSVPTTEGQSRFESGVSLVIVLIALVIMSLAGVGLVRMVDTGSLVVGNVAFKQSTTSAADTAVEGAIGWIRDNGGGTSLYQNNLGAGYYASSLDELDIAGKANRSTRILVDWENNGCAYAASGSFATCVTPTGENSNNGYSTRYLIARMCKTVGDPNATGNGCARPVSNASTQSPKRGELKYGEDKRFANASGPYYRIVVRSEGPRKTVSFTESYVHF